MEGYARHLDGVLRELGVQRVHLVLHDFGGPWGLAWATQNKDRVASVTLVNIGILPGYRWHKFARIWRAPVLGELAQLTATRRGFRVVLNADNPKPFPPAFLDRMYDDYDWGMKRAVLKLYRATPDPGGALSERAASALGPLSLPALVVWGEGDAFVPVRYAEIQKRYFDAEVHLLPGCGHWPMIDEPERVRDLVIPFLRKQVGATGGPLPPAARGPHARMNRSTRSSSAHGAPAPRWPSTLPRAGPARAAARRLQSSRATSRCRRYVVSPLGVEWLDELGVGPAVRKPVATDPGHPA